MTNILQEVQEHVASKLNADPQLSACPFLVENRKDIDYEIRQALSRQGIVGLVLTPKATFAGAYMDVGLAWQLDELEIDIVENVQVNRGKKESALITGQDAAMRVFNVLCPLSGDNEGQFSPVSYAQGEDGSLLVNKCVLKCLVHPTKKQLSKTTIVLYDGTSEEYTIVGEFSKQWFIDNGYCDQQHFQWYKNPTSVQLGDEVSAVGEQAFMNCPMLSSVSVPRGAASIGRGAFENCGSLSEVSLEEGLSSIDDYAFTRCESLQSIVVPSSVTQINGSYAFYGCYGLQLALFKGKTLQQVQNMANYPWGITSTSIIHGELDVPTQVQYVGGSSWEGNIVGPLAGAIGAPTTQIPNAASAEYISLGTCVTSISSYAFWNCASMKSIEIPDSVSSIGTGAFTGCTGLSSIAVPEGVAEIGYRAMYNCRYVKDVSVPSSVSSIGSDAFLDCYSLENVMFKGKTLQQVSAMANYPWGIRDTSVISAEL